MLVRKLNQLATLTPDDISLISLFEGERKTIKSRQDIMREGSGRQKCLALHDGWTFTYKYTADGGRQIIGFQIPGDFVGLLQLFSGISGYSCQSITAVAVSEVDVARLLHVFCQSSKLGEAVIRAAARDEAMLFEHLVDIGRRCARARTAHLLLELQARLQAVGLASSTRFACPLSQFLLADALGLSAVHLNRVLRELREEKLALFQNGIVTLLDIEGLIELTGFDVAYLHQSSGLGATQSLAS